MTQTAHTPTPWVVKLPAPSRHPFYEIRDADERYVAGVHIMSDNRPHQTAAFIVRACNAHEDLVAALRVAQNYIAAIAAHRSNSIAADGSAHELSDRLSAALAKAGAA